MLSDIQYFAAHYVMFKDNLTQNEKIQVIEWIKTSADDKIKSLLIRGDYDYHQEAVEQFNEVFHLLNETTSVGKILSMIDSGNATSGELISNLVNLKYQGWHLGAKAARQQMGAAAIAAVVLVIAYKAYKRFYSKAAKACAGKKGDIKTSCMNKFKREALKSQMITLQKGTAACRKTKDPNKCKNRIQTKLRSIKVKLGTI